MASLRPWLKLTPLLLLLSMACARYSLAISPCEWSVTIDPYIYTFDLTASTTSSKHGVVNEDGFYKVVQKAGVDDGVARDATFWFQLCGHMKFNVHRPECYECPQSCGGVDHCGETCSALQGVAYGAYTKCTTIAKAEFTAYSLLDESSPELGLAVNMSMADVSASCPGPSSLVVQIKCLSDKTAEVEAPSQVKEVAPGSCHFVTSMTHPAGCPVKTSTNSGKIGVVGMILIGVLVLLVLYFVIGIAYRVFVDGATGIEVMPNYEFWHDEVFGWAEEVYLWVDHAVVDVYERVTGRHHAPATVATEED
eukprot:TRINITY_DN6175_c0_g1_i3.p1 TRINITY_DN6175_c0_g1~~TRINITY_DN6175_c0_g1_i3.p1  ORF type:complete len:308 (+),score=52.52 TRINITY_DN6175_c0_g1_i3:102-1025(+)